LETFLYTLKAGPAGGLRPPSGPATTRGRRVTGLTLHTRPGSSLTAPDHAANIGGMRRVIQRLDEWGEERPWLTAVCASLVLAAILATIELVVDDTPDWLLTVALSLALTLAWGFKGQAQRRRRQG
jgi:hypothetical protein